MERMSAESRSRIMRGVRSKDTKPEMLVRKALHRAGLRYRLHVRELPGTPDMVFPRHAAIIEVRGCFWHGHVCQLGRKPRTNEAYWESKLSANRGRDARNDRKLRRLGYRLKVVWECELQPATLPRTIEKLLSWLRR